MTSDNDSILLQATGWGYEIMPKTQPTAFDPSAPIAFSTDIVQPNGERITICGHDSIEEAKTCPRCTQFVHIVT